MSTVLAFAFAFLAVALLLWGLHWRMEADQLNDDNLELHARVDDLERQLEPKPRIQFGPQLDKPVTFPEGILYSEADTETIRSRPDHEVVKRLRSVPPQRGGSR